MTEDKVAEALRQLYPKGIHHGRSAGTFAMMTEEMFDEIIATSQAYGAAAPSESGSYTTAGTEGIYSADDASSIGDQSEVSQEDLDSDFEEVLAPAPLSRQEAEQLAFSVLQENRVLEEPEMVEAMAAWKERRDKVNQERRTRGFPPLQVRPPRVQTLAKRVKCFR